MSTMHSDEVKHHSNTIRTMQTTYMRHATVMCDMRCDCMSIDMRCEYVRSTCDNEQNEACNHERTCTSFGMAIAAARLTSDGADAVHELAEEWRLRG